MSRDYIEVDASRAELPKRTPDSRASEITDAPTAPRSGIHPNGPSSLDVPGSAADKPVSDRQEPLSALSPFLQKIYQDWSRARPAGRVFATDLDLILGSMLVPPMPGYYTAFVHGSRTSVHIGSMILPPELCAELIKADPKWNGKPIRLASCQTGKDAPSAFSIFPFAQELAEELQVRVRAPSDSLWIFSKGELVVSSKEVDASGNVLPRRPPDGEWHEFTPRS
ncbi:hypothetical protein AB0B25_28190 [Nocardia sp. NPDC049190]|uniref:hypothetical protein n=1 Tax=Nocardia sp. NPDC049190 TaxID=3155650 RepID=UPI0033E0E1B7